VGHKQQLAGHAELHHQYGATGDDGELLATALETDDGGAFEERAGVTRAIDNVLAMEQGAKDRRADQMGGERPADGFNLGKLGHFQKLADCREMLARRSGLSNIGNPPYFVRDLIALLDTQPKQVNNPVLES